MGVLEKAVSCPSSTVSRRLGQDHPLRLIDDECLMQNTLNCERSTWPEIASSKSDTILNAGKNNDSSPVHGLRKRQAELPEFPDLPFNKRTQTSMFDWL